MNTIGPELITMLASLMNITGPELTTVLASLSSLVTGLYTLAVKLGKIEAKLDSVHNKADVTWDYLMRRAQAEGYQLGLYRTEPKEADPTHE